jgi:hypothetical protein
MKSSPKFQRYSKRAKWVVYTTAALVAANFLIFIAISLYLGGDALSGYVQAGKYFVCAHGACNQVSPEVWRYSYWHATTAMYGILLVFVELAVFVNTGDISIE